MPAPTALVVVSAPDGAPTPSLDALNARLAEGWTVGHALPMGGGGAADGFAVLVVLDPPAASAAEALLEQMEAAIDAPEASGVQDPLLRRLAGDADDLGPLENRGDVTLP